MEQFLFNKIRSDGTYAVSGGDALPEEPILPSKQKKIPVTRVAGEGFKKAPIYRAVIPEGIVHLGDYAFEFCELLEEAVLPESLRTIGTACFMWCERLSSIRLPEHLAAIGPYAFENCSELTELEFPVWLKLLGDSACGGSGLRRAVFRGSLKRLPYEMFRDCHALEEVVFPEGLTHIGNGAFKNCTYLSDMVIPDGVEVLESWCFEGCLSLKRVVIPKSVQLIDYRAFADCPALSEAVFEDPADWMLQNGSQKMPCRGFASPDMAAKFLRNACELSFIKE